MLVATAGHVDHGKTSLVKNLTGMETDRLEEEKRRGLSINLGFAYTRVDDSASIGFIDVPGHQRFINNMIAGIHGIDLGMLVIAADDGVMPQTHEHLHVLRLLGVTRFVLVISKIDRVDDGRRQAVREAARALLAADDAVQVFEISNISGAGIADLQTYLQAQQAVLQARPASGYFRLSIDRVFLIKGAGLVVTGTVSSGQVQREDTLLLLPQNRSLRVRSLQVQEEEADSARAGQRCALNISGDISKAEIERGDWLVDARIGYSGTRFDATFSMLKDSSVSLKHMSPVKLYIGAKRVAARLALLDRRSIAANEEALVQVIVKRPLQCCHGDRFLIRDDSESTTLGGGIVLDQRPPVKRRAEKNRLQVLKTLQQAGAWPALQRLTTELNQAVNIEQYCANWNIHADDKVEALPLAESAKLALIENSGSEYVVATDVWQAATDFVVNSLQDGTEVQPRDEVQRNLQKRFPGLNAALLFAHLHNAKGLVVSKDRVALPAKAFELSEAETVIWTQVQKQLQAAALKVPVLSELSALAALDAKTCQQTLKALTKAKCVIAISTTRVALPAQLQQFAALMLALGKEGKPFSVADFKNQAGIGRNLAVEVLEYFDRIGFSARKDSGRVIVNADKVAMMLK